MTNKITDYYVTNYSQCKIEESFLASWQGLDYSSHAVQAVTLVFHAITFYIILKKTPVTMKNVKWPLLVNHMCCTWFDFTACTLVIPFFIIDSLGGFGVGLLHFLGAPVLAQITVAVLALFLLSGSYNYLFESRSSAIQNNRFRITKTRTRVVYVVCNFLLNCCIFVMFWLLPENQEVAMLDSFKRNPCPPREFFQFDIFIIAVEGDFSLSLATIFASFLLLFAQANIFFHAFICVYYLFIVPSAATSTLTRKFQQKFFIGIVFQTLTIVSLTVIPFLMLLVIFHGSCTCQGFVNLAVLILGTHGLGATITVLTVHSPYRKALKEIFITPRENKTPAI